MDRHVVTRLQGKIFFVYLDDIVIYIRILEKNAEKFDLLIENYSGGTKVFVQ